MNEEPDDHNTAAQYILYLLCCLIVLNFFFSAELLSYRCCYSLFFGLKTSIRWSDQAGYSSTNLGYCLHAMEYNFFVFNCIVWVS